MTRCLSDPSHSEEVTQEVYLELWQNAARFDAAKGKAVGWMLIIARRRAIDRVRASQSSRDRDFRVGVRDQPDAYDVVSETLQTRFENARVRDAMEKISAAQRQAIEMVYVGAGFTQGEVAEQLGVKVGTVETRLRDGLIALRRVLDAEPVV